MYLKYLNIFYTSTRALMPSTMAWNRPSPLLTLSLLWNVVLSILYELLCKVSKNKNKINRTTISPIVTSWSHAFCQYQTDIFISAFDNFQSIYTNDAYSFTLQPTNINIYIYIYISLMITNDMTVSHFYRLTYLLLVNFCSTSNQLVTNWSLCSQLSANVSRSRADMLVSVRSVENESWFGCFVWPSDGTDRCSLNVRLNTQLMRNRWILGQLD